MIGSQGNTHLLTSNIQTDIFDTLLLDCDDNTYLQTLSVYNEELIATTVRYEYDTLFNYF